METVTYSLPTFLACYFVNDDSSGLSDAEITYAEAFVSRTGAKHCLGIKDDCAFSWSHDFAESPLGGNVATFIFAAS